MTIKHVLFIVNFWNYHDTFLLAALLKMLGVEQKCPLDFNIFIDILPNIILNTLENNWQFKRFYLTTLKYCFCIEMLGLNERYLKVNVVLLPF